jgi:hypothetical protein
MAIEKEVVSLKEHFEKILSEKDKAINIALAAAKEAVAVAETNAEKWRSNANEWRGAMSDREKTFVMKTEFEAYKEATEKAMVIEKARADKLEGKKAGIVDFLGWIIAAIAIIGFIIDRLIKK